MQVILEGHDPKNPDEGVNGEMRQERKKANDGALMNRLAFRTAEAQFQGAP